MAIKLNNRYDKYKYFFYDMDSIICHVDSYNEFNDGEYMMYNISISPFFDIKKFKALSDRDKVIRLRRFDNSLYKFYSRMSWYIIVGVIFPIVITISIKDSLLLYIKKRNR